MIREELVFGPIKSRRLGSSLGINISPEHGKLCNFDCIYCECGWNKDGRDDTRIPTPEELERALRSRLESCVKDGIKLDSITFSGDGESTLHPQFPKMIDIALALRDEFYPSCRVSVLSNATNITNPLVVEALKRVDEPILKLDAPTAALAEIINKPQCVYDPAKVAEWMSVFNGNFTLQTIFIKSKEFDTSSPEVLNGLFRLIRQVRPRKIMFYTVARPTPLEGVEKIAADQIKELVKPLFDEGFEIQING